VDSCQRSVAYRSLPERACNFGPRELQNAKEPALSHLEDDAMERFGFELGCRVHQNNVVHLHPALFNESPRLPVGGGKA
jgi:hypothetical protein